MVATVEVKYTENPMVTSTSMSKYPPYQCLLWCPLEGEVEVGKGID